MGRFMSVALAGATRRSGGNSPRMRSTLRSLAPSIGVSTTVATMYAALALVRFHLMQAGVDLAIFAQAVKQYSRGELPWSDIKAIGGFNLLGDHFSPIVALAAPLYRLWPHASSLLVLQSFLVGLTTFLVARAAATLLGTSWGIAVGAVHGCAWGTQALALYEFHEVAFALPLVALVYLYLLNGHNAWAVLWSTPLMLVKEDSVFLLLGVALVLALRRAWILAGVVAVYALGSFAIIVGVVIPRISFYGRYTYWSSSVMGSKQGVIDGALHNLMASFTSGAAPKLLLVLLAPTLGLALRSPLIVGVIPALLSRLTSGDSTYWGLSYHYNGTVTVIVAVAALDSICRLDISLARGIARGVKSMIFAACTILVCLGPIRGVVDSMTSGCGGCTRNISAVLGLVPDGSRVAADDSVASYLVDRAHVYGLHEQIVDSTGMAINPDYIVVDRVRQEGWQMAWVNSHYGSSEYQMMGEAVNLAIPVGKFDIVVMKRVPGS